SCFKYRMPDDPYYAPVVPDMPEKNLQGNGGLFQSARNLNLYEDIKAIQVGDILTVKLSESTNASKSAETKTKKEDTVSIPDPTIFGTTPNFRIPGGLPLKETRDRNLTTTSGAVSNEFKGKGESTQKNTLTGDITVVVAQIFPNKNLFIRGEKWVELNQGSEFIRLSGIVRQEDITPENTIESSKIANVRISYGGDGAPAESNMMGWLARFFNSPLQPF
ncbi:MAG: flagellar basal body L-ring protein FlgH, partial [Gammaproteobacteria bacterium]